MFPHYVFNSDTNVQECDATNVDRSNSVDLILLSFQKDGTLLHFQTNILPLHLKFNAKQVILFILSFPLKGQGFFFSSNSPKYFR